MHWAAVALLATVTGESVPVGKVVGDQVFCRHRRANGTGIPRWQAGKRD
jgi:hypothetical protein